VLVVDGLLRLLDTNQVGHQKLLDRGQVTILTLKLTGEMISVQLLLRVLFLANSLQFISFGVISCLFSSHLEDSESPVAPFIKRLTVNLAPSFRRWRPFSLGIELALSPPGAVLRRSDSSFVAA
jgi:hypothetical protein